MYTKTISQPGPSLPPRNGMLVLNSNYLSKGSFPDDLQEVKVCDLGRLLLRASEVHPVLSTHQTTAFHWLIDRLLVVYREGGTGVINGEKLPSRRVVQYPLDLCVSLYVCMCVSVMYPNNKSHDSSQMFCSLTSFMN